LSADAYFRFRQLDAAAILLSRRFCRAFLTRDVTIRAARFDAYAIATIVFFALFRDALFCPPPLPRCCWFACRFQIFALMLRCRLPPPFR